MTVDAAEAPIARLPTGGLIVATVLVGITLAGITSSLPIIVASLRGSQADYAAVITGSLLSAAIGLPVWGVLADRVNRGTLLRLALGLLSAASLAAALAPTVLVLIVARSTQGFAAGGITTLVAIVIGTLVPIEQRSGRLGVIAATMSVSIAIGPVLCGLITDTIGWRWVFGGAALLALVACLVLIRVLQVPTVLARRGRFDIAGLTLIAIGITSVIVAIARLGATRGSERWPIALLVAGLLVLAISVFVERRAAHPILSPRVLRERTVGLVCTISFTIAVAQFGVGLFVNQYLQIVLGMSVAHASVALVPQVFGTIIASLLVGRLVQRSGRYKAWIVTGAGLTLAATAMLVTVGSHTSSTMIGGIVLLLGFGLGAAMQNLVLAAQAAVPADDLSAATSSVSFFASLGGVVGASVLASVMQARLYALSRDVVTSGGDPAISAAVVTVPDPALLAPDLLANVRDLYASALGEVFLLMTPVVLIAFLCAIALRSRSVSKRISSASPSIPYPDSPIPTPPIEEKQ